MSEPRDPLIDAIHAAGEVPPPPDRDTAFARAMQPVLMPSRRRLSRGFIALFAAASLAAPAAVFAAHETRTHAADTTPIVDEQPDPGSPAIHRETDDATLAPMIEPSHEAEHQTSTVSGDDHGGATTTTDGHSGTSSPTTTTDHSGTSDPGGSSGSGDGPTVSPTPTPSSTESSGSGSGSGSSPDGGALSGSSDGATPSPTPTGTSAPH